MRQYTICFMSLFALLSCQKDVKQNNNSNTEDSITEITYSTDPQDVLANKNTETLLDHLEAKQSELKEKLEELIKDNNIEEAIEENIVFDQLDKPRYLWSLFLFSGYLKAIKQNENKYILTIPNKEIKNLYVKIVEDYVEQTINNCLQASGSALSCVK